MLSNQRIIDIKEIVAPHELLANYAPTESDIEFILQSRATVENILVGKDNRLMVIVGPCSIHDIGSALEYATFFKTLQNLVPNLFLVMRVYFEKPRSRIGWKGLIYDPDLDESFNINKGLDIARKLLLSLTQMRIPIGCEFLDTLTPQYLSDLVSWGAIGARTSESQIHRQLASGLSMPIGFKNLTSGDYDKAIDGILSAAYPHNFLGVSDQGKVSHVQTKGNLFGHVILRGGELPNYDAPTLTKVSAALAKEKIATGIIVDGSHGNSQKEYNRQLLVALHILRQRQRKPAQICGIMLESNLQKGKQTLDSCNPSALTQGVSITDACIDIHTTRRLLQILNSATVVSGNTIAELRQIIRAYDTCIYENNIETFEAMNYSMCASKYILEEDKEVADLCRGKENEESLMMAISIRLSFSERMAELKLAESPFEYMYAQNDFLPLITRRDIEKTILQQFPNPIFLKIMEMSKRIQIRCLELLTKDIRIGYLFGPGTFSHEVVKKFRGIHCAYPSIDALKVAIVKKEIDYMIIPSYNSIIGEIYTLPSIFVNHRTLEHPIELALYSNNIRASSPVNLYIEPHILKECKSYIQKIKPVHTILTDSSVDGCVACIQDIQKGIYSLTISSKHNRSNFLTTVATDLVPHNITTFSFVSLASSAHQYDHLVKYDMSVQSLPESMELLCRM